MKEVQTHNSSTLAEHPLQAFMQLAGSRIATHDSDIARLNARALLRPVENADTTVMPERPPEGGAIVQFVPALATLTPQFTRLSESSDDLVRHFFKCVADLHWRQAGFGKLPAPIREKIFVVELVGPSGMFYHTDARCGLLLQREHVHYPRHSHTAEELYLVLAGNAKWAVDGNPPTVRKPGAFVQHHSLQPHSMTTDSEALLALWGWSGDLNGASYTCC